MINLSIYICVVFKSWIGLFDLLNQKMKSSDKGFLKIGSHNTQGGIIKKLEDSKVANFVRDFDIFMFQEVG